MPSTSGESFRKRLEQVVGSYSYYAASAGSHVVNDMARSHCEVYRTRLAEYPTAERSSNRNDRLNSVFTNNFIDMEQVNTKRYVLREMSPHQWLCVCDGTSCNSMNVYLPASVCIYPRTHR